MAEDGQAAAQAGTEVPAGSQAQGVVKYADTFEGEKPLEKGLREITTKLGMPDLPEGDLIGDGKQFATAKIAEMFYLDRKSMLQNGLRVAPKAPPTVGRPGEGLQIETPKAEENDDVFAIAKKAGLDMAALEAAFLKNQGKLDPDHYIKIRAVKPSLTNGDIDLIAKGHAAENMAKSQAIEQSKAQAIEVAGGKEALDFLINEFGPTLSPEDKADINTRLADVRYIRGAVRDLKAMHEAAVGSGKSKPLISGTSAASAAAMTQARFNELIAKTQRGGADDSVYAELAKVTPEQRRQFTRIGQ